MKTWMESVYKGIYHLSNLFLTFFAFLVVFRWLLQWVGDEYLINILVFLTQPAIDFLSKITGLPGDIQYDVYRPAIVIILLFSAKIVLGRFTRAEEGQRGES